MNNRALTLPLVVLAGALLALAVVPLIGWWSAVAVPVGYFDAFRSLGSLELGHLLWSFAVVGLLGAGIVVFGVSLAALELARASRVVVLATLLAGFYLGAHALMPALQPAGGPALPGMLALRPWWGYGIELAVLTSVLAAGWLYGRRQPPTDPA